MKNLEIVNETDYLLVRNDLFLINEVAKKINTGVFKSFTFKINEKVHLDFYDFPEKIYICNNK